MATALDRKTDLDFVRHQLDVLSASRCMNGLNAAGERHYQELCALEQQLLELQRAS
jgi:hypothetical protein